MKKQAKKKAVTKKKATKKKATKKKPAKKKVNIKKIEIVLKQNVGATPEQAHAKRRKPAGPGDKVRWWNKTAGTVKLTFGNWPFVETEQTISIGAGKKSRWFTVAPGARVGRHGYAIDPSISDPTAPPDSPAVIVED